MTITHSKVSSVADSADTSLVRPVDWNAAHSGSNLDKILNSNGSSYAATAANIQVAIDDLPAGRTWKEKVWIPGDIGLTTRLEVPSYTILEIQGRLKWTGGVSTTQSLIHNSGGYATQNQHIEIIGGGILDGDSKLAHLIHYEYVDQSAIQNICFRGIKQVAGAASGIGVVWGSYYYGNEDLRNCKILDSIFEGSGGVDATDSGIWWNSEALNHAITERCRFSGFTTAGIMIDDHASGVYISKSLFEGMKYGIQVRGYPTYDSVLSENRFLGQTEYGFWGLAGAYRTLFNKNHFIGCNKRGMGIFGGTDNYITENEIICTGASGVGEIGVYLGGVSYTKLMENNISGYTDAAQGYALNGTDGTDYLDVFDNDLRGNRVVQTGLGANTKIRSNWGYKTENSGTATIPSGTDYIYVNHGLDHTPSLNDISVTPANSMGLATKFNVQTPTSTQFTIVVNTDPGATTAIFVWNIERV